MDSKRPPLAGNIDSSTMIHDDDCERMVLGTLLSSPGTIADVRDHLSPQCFYSPQYQEIYEAITSVDNRGEEINFISVCATLSKMGSLVGPEDICTLMQCYTLGNLTTYALRLKELDIRRGFWEMGRYLMQNGVSETEDIADVQEESHRRLVGLFSSVSADIHTLGESYNALREQIQRNRENTGRVYGTPTGFREIDFRGGLIPTDLIIIAGETSNGKTAFALSLAVNAIKAGHPVAIYSMEMSSIQLTARIAAMESGVGSRELLQNSLPADKIRSVDRAMSALPMELCYFDDDATSSFDKIASSIRSMVLRHGIKGAIVDYLQILNVNMKSANKEQAMGEVARRLKNLAKELDIWIIALSQLNRDRDNPRPTLNRLRDSGQIGEAADLIALIWRPSLCGRPGIRYPEPYSTVSTQGTAMIDFAKGRNTGIYSFICGFNAETTSFYDIDPLSLPRHRSDTSPTTASDCNDDPPPDAPLPF